MADRPSLRERLASVRQRFRKARRKKDDTKPHSERRGKLTRLVRFLRERKDRLVQRLRRRRAAPKINTNPGEPHWGGSGDLMAQVIEPFMVKRGLPIGSGKRTPAYNAQIGGSPTSDHLTTKTTTMARDFPTFSGADDAHALAAFLGFGGWSQNTYTAFNYTWQGVAFRVQILWGSAIGHGDHVHVGVSRA